MGIGLVGISPAARAAEQDPASLDRLADIVTLPPVSWWPPAPAWYVVIGVVLVLFIAFVIKAWQRRWRNIYRANALAELNRVEQGTKAVTHIAQILKRTALAVVPRQKVAALNGERWVQWLNQAGNSVTFSERSGQILSEHLYSDGQPSDAEIAALARSARAWIRKHQVVSMSAAALTNHKRR